MTFFNFPYEVPANIKLEQNLYMPDLLSLVAMKVFALGGRAKWKDYIDLYFLLKDYYDLDEITNHAKSIFGSSYNKKLTKVQLSYFKDIDYQESIEFMEGYEVDDNEVKKYLVDIATSEF